MPEPSTREVVRGYYDAWTSRDLDRARGYLADDLDFQGSLRRFSRAEDFLPALDQFLQILEEVHRPGGHDPHRGGPSATGRSARSGSSSIRPS